MTITDIKKAHVFIVARYMIFSMIGIILFQVAIYLIAPPPDTALGMFELFDNSPFLGLLSLDLLYLINNALLIMVYFSITLYLISYKPLLALLALLVGSIGIATYYASNPAFEFLFLSKNFPFASAIEQERLVIQGELLLSNYIGTAFISYYILNAIALYIYSISLLLAKGTPKRVGILGLVSAILMSIPSSFGVLGIIFALGSLIPWIIFCVFIAQLFKTKIKTIYQNQ